LCGAGYRRGTRKRVALPISPVKSSFVSLSNTARLDLATANAKRSSAPFSALGFHSALRVPRTCSVGARGSAELGTRNCRSVIESTHGNESEKASVGGYD